MLEDQNETQDSDLQLQTLTKNSQHESVNESLDQIVRTRVARWRFICLALVRKAFPNRKLYECMPLATDLSSIAYVLVFCISMLNFGISIFNLSWLVSIPLVAVIVWARKNNKVSLSGLFLFWGFCAAACNVNTSLTLRALLLGITCAVIAVGVRQNRIYRDRFTKKPFRLDNINTGTGRILVGKVHVLNVFVESTDAKRYWSPRNRKQSIRETKNALKWLVQQAKENFQTDLSFDSRTLFPSQNFDSKVPCFDDSDTDHETFQSWINESLLHEVKVDHRFQEVFAHGNVILLVHCNKALRSYAVPHHQFTEPNCQIEYAVISHPPYRQVIAHELLHLFGADDYYPEAYGLSNDSENSNELGGKIMYETSPRLSELEVDVQTAEKIGWL